VVPCRFECLLLHSLRYYCPTAAQPPGTMNINPFRETRMSSACDYTRDLMHTSPPCGILRYQGTPSMPRRGISDPAQQYPSCIKTREYPNRMSSHAPAVPAYSHTDIRIRHTADTQTDPIQGTPYQTDTLSHRALPQHTDPYYTQHVPLAVPGYTVVHHTHRG
jgi:hypothetical protein